MSDNQHDALPSEELRRRADEWMAKLGGSEALARSLEGVGKNLQTLRKDAAIDPREFDKAMTV